jgi:glycosyltransferase involved in cell wall biosynthesis
MKISIITVCFNAEKTIEQTIKSVLSQTYANIEYIIVDGKSIDSTLRIVNKYKKISKVISEKDNGLYDAMNKGVKLAKGQVIYFLNADDVLIDKNVVREVMVEFENNKLDFVLGDIDCFYPDTNSIVRKNGFSSIEKIRNGVMPPHQASFVKKTFLKKYPFNIKYKSSSDFDFFCNLLKEKPRIKKLNKVIARMIMTGVSSNNISYYETEKIVYEHFGVYYFFKILVKNRFFIVTKFMLKKFRLTKFWRKINHKLKII